MKRRKTYIRHRTFFFFFLHSGKQGLKHYKADSSSIKFGIFLFHWYIKKILEIVHMCTHEETIHRNRRCSANIGLNGSV